MITRYSDSLLAMLLRKSNPQFWDKAELAVNVRGQVTSHMQIDGSPTRESLMEALNISDLTYLTRDERHQMGLLLNQIIERKEKQGTGRHQGYMMVPALEDETNE